MKFAAVLAAAALVAGCARLPAVSDGLSDTVRADRLRSIENWNMSGRIAVDTGERAFQARFRWRRSPDSLSLTVRGPLGAGSFRIDGNGDRLTVLSRGEERVLTDPEAELSAMFGWWLPVTSLESWLIGLPDGRFPVASEGAGRPSQDGFDQRLWAIRYEEFQLSNGLLVPRHVRMTHDPLALDLTIDDWSPTDPAPAGATLN